MAQLRDAGLFQGKVSASLPPGYGGDIALAMMTTTSQLEGNNF